MENDAFGKECLDGKVCKSKVYNAKTLPESESNVEAEISLDEPALEIKRIKKNLF